MQSYLWSAGQKQRLLAFTKEEKRLEKEKKMRQAEKKLKQMRKQRDDQPEEDFDFRPPGKMFSGDTFLTSNALSGQLSQVMDEDSALNCRIVVSPQSVLNGLVV